ncbi:drug/metabolite transporter (DMT)-like permease [Lactobacillus colini]|uniref:Drug/metabolite transporter (DMT)-like permease n=2 Tax=Lactobacillus colini TaxID=1819254 RepID=A0ABS4MGJ1_9LACO|nr:EamA family transporter [Lactobacillus colini]MBP2058806.1 drug/metabolite transporter (DMT)-like permease [Lactobacillus colini]
MASKKRLWTLLAALACIFWGISGLFAEGLFNISPEITPIWITQVRMVISGVLLLIFAQITGKKPLAVMRDKKDAVTVISYGLLGLVPVQYCYFIVVQQANASIATILQFVGPFFVMIYMVGFEHQALRRVDVLAGIVAFIGVFFLATHGHFNQLSLSPMVLFWGFLSAVGVATNTLIPRRLLDHTSSLVVTGWGLLIAGIALSIFHPIWPHLPQKSISMIILLMLGVIVIGTLIPFQWMMGSLRYIAPSTASLLDAFEPVSATLGSVLVFRLVMAPIDWLGAIMIILAVAALSWQPKKK